jgi:hypothetical protein
VSPVADGPLSEIKEQVRLVVDGSGVRAEWQEDQWLRHTGSGKRPFNC